MNIVNLKINDLIPYENNPRNNDGAVEYVARSIEQFGFKVPIVVDKNNIIVAGHTRYKASVKLGLKEVPCIVADDLTEEQVNAFRLADNKVGEYATWDFAKLDEELEALKNIDMEQFGFDMSEFDFGDDKEIIEDSTPELSENPKAKYGDVYKLGNHRLMCGDSTKAEDIQTLMEGRKADIVFTDPPYGMKKENCGVANDNLNFDDLLQFNKQWIPLSFDYTKDNGSWYCWGMDEPLMDIYSNILKPMAKQCKITFRNLLTWDKGHGQGQLSDGFRMYATADEKCLFVMRGVQGFSNNADNYYEAWDSIRIYLKKQRDAMGWNNADMKRIVGHSETSGCHWFDKSQWVMPTEEEYKAWQKASTGKAFKKEYEEIKKEYEEIKKEYEEIKKEYEEIKKEYYKTRSYFDNTHDNMNNVWHFNRAVGEEREMTGGHATPKPIALCGRAIKTSSREGEAVLDLFGGSGSTLIACEQLNRNCYTMELEPKWVDVIIERWENFTGQKAVKLK